MLYSEIIAVFFFSDPYKTHKHTARWQNAKFFNAVAHGTCSNRLADGTCQYIISGFKTLRNNLSRFLSLPSLAGGSTSR